MTDDELLQAIRLHDDREAFSVLVKRYQSVIRVLLRRLTNGDADAADDLAQETFLNAYASISQFRGSSTFGTWLHRIAYNQFISSQRKRNISRHSSFLDVESEVTAIHAEPQSSIGDLRDALAKLTVEQRSVIYLSYERGFTHVEISNIMDCPVGTVKSHMNRGKHRLRQILKSSQELAHGN